MEAVDVVLLIILGFAAVSGFRKGFIMELVSILAFILAIIGGFKLLHIGIEVLQDQFNLTGRLVPYLAFLLIFIGIILLMNILGRVVKKAIDMTLLGSVDNFAGSLMGALKWAFGLSVLIWIFNYFQINPLDMSTRESPVYAFVEGFAPKVVEYIAIVLPFADGAFGSIEQIAAR